MTTHIDPEYQASAIEAQVQQDWETRNAMEFSYALCIILAFVSNNV